MADTSPIPVRRADDPRQAKAKPRVDGAEPSALPSISPSGPRKLIRPHLPETGGDRYAARSIGPVFPKQPRWNEAAAGHGESSHAEAFYFQKQIHSQTLMIFVLEDGQQIEGYIEWYDRNSIKVRHGTRTLIYKSSIKYIYKAADNNGG